MDEIDIFDVASYYNDSTPHGTWYKQTTSGATPDPRIDFCLILASAPEEKKKHRNTIVPAPIGIQPITN